MEKYQSFQNWKNFFIDHKWLILESLEKGSIGRTQFEMASFEWPHFLESLKVFEAFILKDNKKSFIPKGKWATSLECQDSVFSLWLKCFLPALYENKAEVSFHDAHTYFIELLKGKLKNDSVFRRLTFIQKNNHLTQINFSASILQKTGVSDKELDHLVWSAFYASGFLSGSLKFIFVPEDMLVNYRDRLIGVMDQVRAPFVDKNLFENNIGLNAYREFQLKCSENLSMNQYASVFHKEFKVFTIKKLKDFPFNNSFVYGPYFFIIGYKYLKTLIEFLNSNINSNSNKITSVSFFGDQGFLDKNESDQLVCKDISYGRHFIFEQITESRLTEYRTQCASLKQTHTQRKMKKPFEFDFIHSWKNSKMSEDLSRFSKALPFVSKKIMEKINQTAKNITYKK